MLNLEEFEKLKDFCNYNTPDLSERGVAYQHKEDKRIRCFKYVDLERGRGDTIECKGLDCKHYIYVSPNQTTLTGIEW